MLKISFTGYLGADCNQRHVNDHVAITFSVGVTRQYKNRQGQDIKNTTWIGCTLWRKPENTRIAEFLKRGQQVYVEGEPSARAWISNADGSAKCSLDCRVSEVELLGKSVDNSTATAADGPHAQVETIPASPPAAAPAVDPKDNDDLPF